MTRARNNLILLSYDNAKQPFVDSIEKFTRPKELRTTQTGNANKKAGPVIPSGYEIGARVYHDIFGQGQITDTDQDIVTIRFDSKGTKKLSIKVCEEQMLLRFL